MFSHRLDTSELFFTEKVEDIQFYTKVTRSLHGSWLLKNLCPIKPNQIHLEHLGRLLGMAFVWVEAVEYVKRPEIVEVVRQSRLQVLQWIRKALQYDPNLYCSCLLPNPPLFARVGHPWSMLSSAVRRDLEILQRLITLCKHDLIPENVSIENLSLFLSWFTWIFLRVFLLKMTYFHVAH